MLARNTLLIGLIIISFFLVSCASQSEKKDILEKVLGENLEDDGITFLEGPWYSPGTSYGYHLGRTHLVTVRASDNTLETHFIKLSECNGLATGVKDLKLAVFHTVEVFAGTKSKGESDIIIMDGPIYELKYYSNEISGPIVLRGDGNTKNSVPWIDAAFMIGEIADECVNNS